ncbi:MAG TPA: hypothetical protein GXZ58_10370 [Bacilli bacterium]|nr:hypothetical protein [Bacilli bacterium]
MIEKLKNIYTSLIVKQPNQIERAADYQWFITPANEIIGIEKQELDKKDRSLLRLFLTPYQGAHPPVTTREKKWYQLINEQEEPNFKQQPSLYRFILFTLSEPLIDPTDFREAIDGLYSTRPAIVWVNQLSGMIIEEEAIIDEEMLSYEEMIEVFTIDFYLDVRFYIGPYLSELNKAHDYFSWMQDSYQKLKKFSTKPVMSYVTAIPYLLTTITNQADGRFLIDAMLKDTVDDEELLRSIQIFLECNSNVSLAAKELYMHRNSLQYRIDKFIEKTTIDVKQFENALAVYLVLLLKRHFD